MKEEGERYDLSLAVYGRRNLDPTRFCLLCLPLVLLCFEKLSKLDLFFFVSHPVEFFALCVTSRFVLFSLDICFLFTLTKYATQNRTKFVCFSSSYSLLS